MFGKKAQLDLGPRELVLTLVFAGLLGIVGLLIFSNVTNTTESIFEPTATAQSDESITISVTTLAQDNSTLLANLGFITGTDIVKNASSPFFNLTRDVDYVITINGLSGGLDTVANFTLLNVSGSATFNNSPLTISYGYNTQSAAQATKATLDTTVLDSYELGMIALIVLAAVVILAILFKMGSQ